MLDTSDAYSAFGESIMGGVALAPLETKAAYRTAAQDGQVIGATILGIGPGLATRVVGKVGELAGSIAGAVAGLLFGTIASIASKVTGENYGSFKEVFLDMVKIFREGTGQLAGILPALASDVVMLVGAAIGWCVGKPIEMYRARQQPYTA
ncbi:hypothetical protein ACUSIJ_17195 [Pseudochelatococcus sp. B33]